MVGCAFRDRCRLLLKPRTRKSRRAAASRMTASIRRVIRRKGLATCRSPRDEWVAGRIVAYFNLDLRQVRAFGLGGEVERLLVMLALFKIRKFLAVGLRLRTACDLDVTRITVTRPKTFALPSLAELETELPALIESVGAKGLFGEPRALTVTYRK